MDKYRKDLGAKKVGKRKEITKSSEAAMMSEYQEQSKKSDWEEMREREILLSKKGCDPFEEERRQAECEKFTEENIAPEDDSECEAILGDEKFDPCERPQARAWGRIKSITERIKRKVDNSESQRSLAEVLEILRKSFECGALEQDDLEKLKRNLSQLRKKHNDEEFEDLFLEVWRFRQLFQTESTTENLAAGIFGLLSNASQRFTDYDSEEQRCTPNWVKKTVVGKPDDPALKKVLRRIKQQKNLICRMQRELSFCAQYETVTLTRRKMLWLQVRIEDNCCSLLCELRERADCYDEDSSKRLSELLGDAVHDVAQVRSLLEQMQIDPACPWKQFNDKLNTFAPSVDQLLKKVHALKPPVEPYLLQGVRDHAANIVTTAQLMLGKSSSLRTIASDSCGLIGQFRQAIAQIGKEIGALLCIKDVVRCGVRAILIEMSCVTVQVNCYLGYMHKECDRASVAKPTQAPQAALPPMVKIVDSIPQGNAGVLLEFPPELVRQFGLLPNAYVNVLDGTTKTLLQVVPVDGSTTTLAFTAPQNAIFEIQVYGDGEKIGTAIATAEV